MNTLDASVLHDRDWVADRLNAGDSVSAIARTCGVTRQAVQQWIRRYGLTHTPPPPSRHDRRPQPAELEQLYRDHGSITSVAAHLHVNPATVGRWCHEAGITLNDRGRRPLDLPVDTWRRQREQGWTIAQIATTAGVSATTVRRHLNTSPTG
jgi:transposase-like protein